MGLQGRVAEIRHGGGEGPLEHVPVVASEARWCEDIYPGVASCTGPERWFALRLAVGRLLDAYTVCARVGRQRGVDPPAEWSIRDGGCGRVVVVALSAGTFNIKLSVGYIRWF